MGWLLARAGADLFGPELRRHRLVSSAQTTLSSAQGLLLAGLTQPLGS